MAPENLPCLNGENMVPSSHKKSKEGDVWAFGVVLFEIWTRGEFPFGGLTDKKVVLELWVQICKLIRFANSFTLGVNIVTVVQQL